MATEQKKSVFETLNAIDCSEHIEKKNGLTYLAWAWAWAMVKKHYPDATFNVYENKDGLNYHHDGRTAWVKTGVTIEGIEMIEYLPVMDNRNQSIPLDKVTSFNVNTSIQRSLTKACARHGLGLYIYAGEDLPEEVAKEQAQAAADAKTKIIEQVKAAKDRAEVTSIWNAHKELQADAQFKAAVMEMSKKYPANPKPQPQPQQPVNPAQQ